MKIYVLKNNNNKKKFLLIPDAIEKNLEKQVYFLTGIIYENSRFKLNCINNDDEEILIENWEEITKENTKEYLRNLKSMNKKIEKILLKNYENYYQTNLNEVMVRFIGNDMKKYIIDLIGEKA